MVQKVFSPYSALQSLLLHSCPVPCQLKPVLQSKYSKMKAAYIHNCLKNGQTPVAGPLGDEEASNEEVSIPVPQAPEAPQDQGHGEIVFSKPPTEASHPDVSPQYHDNNTYSAQQGVR